MALESELETCRRSPSKKKGSEIQMIHCHIQNDCGKCNARISGQQVSPHPSISNYQQKQGQQGQDRKHGHGKTMDRNAGKQSRKDTKEEKEDRRPKQSRK